MTTPKAGPILVTGASSGIGNCTVRHLADQGHTVFGTVRKAKDADALRRIPNVTPVLVDVTKPEQVEAGLEEVKRFGAGLYGLVNNAGIGELGMLSSWSDEDIQRIFDVNVFGPHRMTNAFLSLLVASKGRVVNVGSRGGMLSKAYFGPYTMTKHALESYSETLRQELSPYGVHVSVIQPGGVATDIGDNMLPGTIARCMSAKPPFAEECHRLAAAFSAPPPEPTDAEESESNRKPSSPDLVAAAICDALFSPSPKPRYLVGTVWEVERLIETLVDRLLDENDNPARSYTRDELVSLLDDRLAQR